jgi:ankyrin repeat protein
LANDYGAGDWHKLNYREHASFLLNLEIIGLRVHLSQALFSVFFCNLKTNILLAEPRNRANVNVSLQPGGQTALHLAAERGNTTCLQILLNQPDIEVSSSYLLT